MKRISAIVLGGMILMALVVRADDVKRVLVVKIGCSDPAALCDLCEDKTYVVHGLDTNPSAVARARVYIQSQNLYGKVSVQLFDGKTLPYVDNLVNLLMVDEECKVPEQEFLRVLAPRGMVVIDGKKTVKPVPEDTDEWTHYLYGPEGTAVSSDRVAGHPRGLKWTGGPFWVRSHEHTAGMTAMVSANGRIFYVMDEGLTDSIQLPPEYRLVARDAYNGIVLWKYPLSKWFNHLFPVKSGPGWLPRRLVAIEDRVYLAPGTGQDMVCLDAATGKVFRTYKNTATTFELIVSKGIILAAVDPDRPINNYNQQHANCWKERDRASALWQWTPETGMRILKAIKSDTGRVLWEKTEPIAPMSLTANDRLVCYHNGHSMVALDLETGAERWRTPVKKLEKIRTGYAGPRVVICSDRVLFSPMGSMQALSLDTGKILWTVDKKPRSGHYSLEDFFVINDKIWVLNRFKKGVFSTYSLETGKELGKHENPIDSFYIHQRCHPGRATCRFLIPPIMGVELYDIQNDKWYNNHWVRGGCIYGLMPANGLIYTPPHACACYYQSKLNGFDALSPKPAPSHAPPAAQRLIKGPAYGKTSQPDENSISEWPVFRHDNTRSSYVKTDVPIHVAPLWKQEFGIKLSQPTVAGGRVYLSAVDRHTVYCFDAFSGQMQWSFTADGRVDSPPSIYKGLAIFGCKDGFVYALDAISGKLAWKFQGAPSNRKIAAFGQLESVWPISGSVLIQNDRLYCVAGRSMFLDGGLRMLILNPLTGELINENIMDSHVPGTDMKLPDLIMGKHMPVAMPDILSSDGKHIFMKSQTFDLNGRRTRIKPLRPDTQYDEKIHLFAPVSFLDDAWHQRTYWIYGRAAGEGWAEFQYPPRRVPCGRILCIDEENVYSYGRDLELICNTSVSEYRLFCAKKKPKRKVGIPNLEGRWEEGKYQVPEEEQLVPNSVDWHELSKFPPYKLSALNYNWINEEPDVIAKAMVLANDLLFIAGPRDVADEKTLWGHSNEEGFKASMQRQADWLKGRYGGVMQVFSKETGKKLAEKKLGHLPAFDGLVAADGRLYMVTVDGYLVCYGEE